MTLDDQLKTETQTALAARYQASTGVDPQTDVLGFAALFARNWTVSGRRWAGPLDDWMTAMEKQAEKLPAAPTDPDGVAVIGEQYELANLARDHLRACFTEIRDARMFRSCIDAWTGGREEDAGAQAFAIAMVWLWHHAGRKPAPTPGSAAILALLRGVDSQKDWALLGSPTRRWKHYLAEARQLVHDEGGRIHSAKMMPIHMLLINYGGTPEGVIATLTEPGYLDAVRRRQGVTGAGHQGPLP